MRRWLVVVLVVLGLALILATPAGAIPNNKNTFTLPARCSGFGDVLVTIHERPNINGVVHVVGGGRFKVVELTFIDPTTGQRFSEPANYPKAPNTVCRGSLSDPEFGTLNFEVTGVLRLR